MHKMFMLFGISAIATSIRSYQQMTAMSLGHILYKRSLSYSMSLAKAAVFTCLEQLFGNKAHYPLLIPPDITFSVRPVIQSQRFGLAFGLNALLYKVVKRCC